MNSSAIVCLGTVFREIDRYECSITRVVGSIILVASVVSVVFSVRFIYWSSYHRQSRSHQYALTLSMISSSMSVTLIVVPSVLVQCLSCHRLCSTFYCQTEGFVSYLNGCVNMFMLMMVSIVRYATVFETSFKSRFIGQHSYWAVALCWLLGLLFAVPPLFKWNKYIPEGIGFHCGLDWFDRSLSSRIYFILAFAFIYFIPLVVLLIVNLYVYCKIRILLHGTTRMSKLNLLLHVSYHKQHSSSSSSSSNSPTGNCEKLRFMVPAEDNSKISWASTRERASNVKINYLMHLNRLRADRRFALATIFLVSEYLLSWTPYAIVALLYIFNIPVVVQQSAIMTICALVAKTSMILNPLFYIATIKRKQFKSILYCGKCTCCYCRISRTIIAS